MTTMASEARTDALVRLDAALVEEDRLGDLYNAAIGTSSEFGAHARLRHGSAEVAAREAWLKSVDDDGLGERIWINGREVGGKGSIFLGLDESLD